MLRVIKNSLLFVKKVFYRNIVWFFRNTKERTQSLNFDVISGTKRNLIKSRLCVINSRSIPDSSRLKKINIRLNIVKLGNNKRISCISNVELY